MFWRKKGVLKRAMTEREEYYFCNVLVIGIAAFVMFYVAQFIKYFLWTTHATFESGDGIVLVRTHHWGVIAAIVATGVSLIAVLVWRENT